MATHEHKRIIVGTAPGARSGRWQIDTSDDDVYITHEGMRKDIKTSLHASGQSHHKMSEGAAGRWLPTDSDRITMKWREPKEFAPGGRVLLEIVIPTDNLTVPPEEPPLKKRERTLLLEPAPPGRATVLSFVLLSPGTTLRSPDGVGSALVASFPLPTRGLLVVMATHQPYVLAGVVEAALPEISAQIDTRFRHGDDRLPPIGEPTRTVLWMAPDDAGVARMVEVGTEIRSGRSPYRRHRSQPRPPAPSTPRASRFHALAARAQTALRDVPRCGRLSVRRRQWDSSGGRSMSGESTDDTVRSRDQD